MKNMTSNDSLTPTDLRIVEQRETNYMRENHQFMEVFNSRGTLALSDEWHKFKIPDESDSIRADSNQCSK